MNYRKYNRRYQPRKRPRITRRGIRISSKLYVGKIVVYMLLIPLLTWYGHQKYTNPFQFHPNIAIDYTRSTPAILLYETSFNDTINRYRITFVPTKQQLENEKVIVVSDLGFQIDGVVGEMFLPSVTGKYEDSSAVITYGSMKIVIPFTANRQKKNIEPVDILVLYKNSIQTGFAIREQLEPRLSVIFDSTQSGLPKNFIPICRGSHYEIVNGRFKTLKLSKEK